MASERDALLDVDKTVKRVIVSTLYEICLRLYIVLRAFSRGNKQTKIIEICRFSIFLFFKEERIKEINWKTK